MIFQVFFVAFLISFFGSIPPGSINVAVVQYAMLNNKRAALFFAIAAATVEFVYAGITVKFQIFLSEETIIADYFKIITAVVLIALGIINITSRRSSRDVKVTGVIKGRHGFQKGLVISLLNPMTIPFWLTITAYLQSNDLIVLKGIGFWSYLVGLTTGSLMMLLLVRELGGRFTEISDNRWLVHIIPGILFIAMGVYNLVLFVM